TAARLRRLGRPHALARAGAVLLASGGAALAIAGAGVALAPSVAAVLVAWLLIGGVTGLAARLALVAGRHATAPAVGRLVEAATGGRPGSIVGLVAATTPAGASAQLWTLADRKAVAVVDGAALAVGRLLARDTRTSLLAATGVAALGAVLFLVAAPGAGRAAAFWHPLRTLADARSPQVRVAVALPAFVAGLELTARYPSYLGRPDEPLAPGGDTIPIPEGTVILSSGAASVPLARAAWRRGDVRAPLAVRGSAFSGRLAPRGSGASPLELAPAAR